uniref:Uncharacterized protein n=1 Tax=Lepeophtheirus salmonis TaxID=72036 RepID=A0A0K2VLB7_LEPSM
MYLIWFGIESMSYTSNMFQLEVAFFLGIPPLFYNRTLHP